MRTHSDAVETQHFLHSMQPIHSFLNTPLSPTRITHIIIVEARPIGLYLFRFSINKTFKVAFLLCLACKTTKLLEYDYLCVSVLAIIPLHLFHWHRIGDRTVYHTHTHNIFPAVHHRRMNTHVLFSSFFFVFSLCRRKGVDARLWPTNATTSPRNAWCACALSNGRRQFVVIILGWKRVNEVFLHIIFVYFILNIKWRR